jgi:hypothetical protein
MNSLCQSVKSKKAVRTLYFHGLLQKEKAVGKEFTHGFEMLLALNF